ncbi:MAG: hypothetical protein ACK41U_00550 [Paracoccus sp. (in: a-proteobacteria)]|uniref:hypothetical protein n=1 Tax=Paracoccus sp. TaxID=267 RepID=UPI00391D2478
MRLWLIAGACLLGAGFVAWGCARLRLRWPLLVLSLLLAAIAVQLFLAARGQGGMHDLAALVAQALTVAPALLGVAVGLGLAHLRGHRAGWRSLPGFLSLLALAVAAGAVVLTFLL